LVWVWLGLISGLGAAAQAPNLDSLAQQLANSPTDTARIKWLNIAAIRYVNVDPALTERFARQADTLATRINFRPGLGNAKDLIGVAFFQRGQYDSALVYHDWALRIHQSVNNKNGLGWAYDNLAQVYKTLGDAKKAIDYYNRSLTYRDLAKDWRGMASTLANLGDFARQEAVHLKGNERVLKLGQSRDYFNRALFYANRSNNAREHVFILTSLGDFYFENQRPDSALQFMRQAHQLATRQDDQLGLVRATLGLAKVQGSQGQFAQAEQHCQQALDITERLQLRLLYSQARLAQARLYLLMGRTKTDSGIDYALAALQAAQNLKARELAAQACALLGQSYQAKGDFEQAFFYQAKFSAYQDSLYTDQRSRVFAALSLNTELELQRQEAANRRQDNLRLRQQSRWLTILGILSGVGFLLAAFMALFYYRSSQQRRRINNSLVKLTFELTEQKEELQAQKSHIESQSQTIQTQHEQLSRQNQMVQQSIRAALNIQQAILPEIGEMDVLFREQFTLFRPKDIVSGDFYWATALATNAPEVSQPPAAEEADFSPSVSRGQTVFLAVADCTGHGVPGAFMTLLGQQLLDRIVNVRGITDPGQVLCRLHTKVLRLLRGQKNTASGMDLAVVALTPELNGQILVQFAAAKRPLYYVLPGGPEAVRVGGDRYSIGFTYDDETPEFTTQELRLPAGTMLYLSSDGYTDQNDPNRRKFGVDAFVKLLPQCAGWSATEQQAFLEGKLDLFMRDAEQRDDILVVGVRL
jgi:serine phosphatase RsbU (regulator of sigma subunit)